MPHPIEPSTLRILMPTGETVGTGFLVSKNLAVTCAHVVKILGAGAGDTIDIRFTGKSAATTARVLPEYWRPDDSTDIAILQVDHVPAGVFPLRMGRASESRLKNDLYTFGYAIAADEQGIGGLGTFITLKQEGNFIQFRMHEANHGHSGAPIYDDIRGVVVGMVKKGHTGAGRNAETTFAIPTETIWQICPQLKPIVSPLPPRNPIVEGINLLPYDYDQRIQNFLTEYLGTESHPVPFGGRDEAMHMLDAWLSKTTPYLLLAAPAGRGKSALLVRWLDSLKEREDLALAFVPVSIRFGTNMERVFYAALAARLAFLHGDDVPASPETFTAVYRGLVADYLSKPLASGRTLLVVLDGLDEAADWQAGADFMPGELPAGVRVVVSARFLAGDADSIPWLRRLNWERNGLASVPLLTPLDRAGVADVLLKMGCPLDELSRKVDIVAELYRLSEGDPLLVGLYVGDLWAQGEEVKRLKPEDLVSIQPGYKGYFNRLWDDQKKLWGKKKPWLQRYISTVLNLLAGALGPLSIADIQALSPKLSSRHISDALDVLQRFIIGDNQGQGYTFSHPKLRQYFWESLTRTEKAQVEERFLAWFEQTFQEFIEGKRDPRKKSESSVYVLRNYTAYLTHTKQSVEKWLPLIHHQEWAQAWFTIDGAYHGYLKDVLRVWKQCKLSDQKAIVDIGKAPLLGRQLRCGLIFASLKTSIPFDLIPPSSLAQLSFQLGGTDDVPKAAYGGYVRVLSTLAQHLPEMAGEALEARRAIQDKYYLTFLLSRLVKHLPEVAQEALEAVQAIQEEWHRADVLSYLAEHLPKTELRQILEAARAMQNEGNRAFLMSMLVKHLPEIAGESLEAVRAVQDERNRAVFLRNLAEHLPEAELGQILEAARTIQNEGDRANLLNKLADRLPEMAREVLEAGRAMQNEGDRAFLMSMLVKHLPEIAGETLEAARAMQNEEYRAFLLSNLAGYLPEVTRETLEAAQAIQNVWYRDTVLSNLAEHLPKTELGQILEATQAIHNEWDRARVLSNLAEHLPKTELGQILEAARAMRAVRYRPSLLNKLAQRLPEVAVEFLEAALEISSDENQFTDVLSEVEHLLIRLPITESYQAMQIAFSKLSFHNRDAFLSGISALMSVITILGTEDTHREIYQAVHDVTTWWP